MFEIIALCVIGAGIAILIIVGLYNTTLLINTQQITNEARILSKISGERLNTIEQYLSRIYSLIMAEANEMNNMMGGQPKEIFGSKDGKHIASSMEDLLKKIAEDPQYMKDNPDEIQKLRDLFQKYKDGEADGFDPDAEDEDPEDPDKDAPWRKKE